MTTEPTERDALFEGIRRVCMSSGGRCFITDNGRFVIEPDQLAAYRAELQREHAAEVERLKRERAQSATELDTTRFELAAAKNEIEIADLQIERLKREKAEAVSALVNADRHLDTARKELAEARSAIHAIAKAAGLVEYGDGGDMGNYSQAEDDEIVEAVRAHCVSHRELVHAEQQLHEAQAKIAELQRYIAGMEGAVI